MLRPNRNRIAAFRNPMFEPLQPGIETRTAEQREVDRAAAFVEWQLRRPALKGVLDAAAINIPLTEQEIKDMFLPFSRGLLRNMSYMALGLYVLVVTNLMIEAYTDPLYQSSSSKTGPVLVVCVQIVLPVGIAMGFFVLTSSTTFVRLGCYGRYLREFALLYATSLFTLLFVFSVKIYFIYALYQNTPSTAIWHLPGYTTIWCIQRVLLLLFWLLVVYSATSAFQEKYFDAEFLITRRDPTPHSPLLGGDTLPSAVAVVPPRGRLAYGKQAAGDGHIEVVGGPAVL